MQTMTNPKSLFLYEEIMLLALRNKQGTATTDYLEYAVAGAVLAELLLDRRIAISDAQKHLIDVQDANPTGDPIIDECLERMRAGKKRASLETWVPRLAGIKNLRHKVAQQLCHRGILRADKDKVLHIFTRRIYPEINPVPEEKILERLRAAILGDDDTVDPRTVVLISLASSADLLIENLGRREVGNRRKRIKQIVNGEMTGKVTEEAIAASQAALLVTVIMPAIMVSVITAGKSK
jgi:Golgi phosphoprotein 3